MNTGEFERIITPDGQVRVLNLTPSDPEAVRGNVMAGPPLEIPLAEIQAFDAWPSVVKIKDQDGRGACFPAGTRVRMGDGSERPIEDVKLLDRVLTAEGNVGPVVNLFQREYGPTILRLILWGHSHLRLTHNHKVLTQRGYVRADELASDDWVAMPRYAPESRRSIVVADHASRRVLPAMAGSNARGGYFSEHEDRKWAGFAESLDMTPGAGRIIGLYMAEGSGCKGRSDRLIWSFGDDERDTYVSELVGLLDSEWGVEGVVVPRPENHVLNVRVYRKTWAEILSSLCGDGAAGKRLHSDMTSGPREFLRNILTGWLDGDGYVRRNEMQGVTISRDLALGMYDVAQAIGYRPSIRRYHSPTYGTVKTRRPRWEIGIGMRGEDNYRCRMDDSHVWRRVRGTIEEPFDGAVFNIEVEGDHSYVAEGVGVKNCNGHAAATAAELSRAMQGYAYVPLSAWWVYGRLVNGRDRGSNIMDALALCSKDGVAPESTVDYGDFSGRYPDAAQSAASRFRIEIGKSLGQNWEAIVTAVALRRGVNLSVRATGGWSGRLDASGCPPVGRGPCNHAVMVGAGLKRLPNGEWLIRMANSWNANWGDGGFCWLSRAHIESTSWFEAYEVTAVAADPQDVHPIAA